MGSVLLAGILLKVGGYGLLSASLGLYSQRSSAQEEPFKRFIKAKISMVVRWNNKLAVKNNLKAKRPILLLNNPSMGSANKNAK